MKQKKELTEEHPYVFGGAIANIFTLLGLGILATLYAKSKQLTSYGHISEILIGIVAINLIIILLTGILIKRK